MGGGVPEFNFFPFASLSMSANKSQPMPLNDHRPPHPVYRGPSSYTPSEKSPELHTPHSRRNRLQLARELEHEANHSQLL